MNTIEIYRQIIYEAYENYMTNWHKELPRIGPCTQEEFINKIKTDEEFSKKWKLKIEEKDFSHEERYKQYNKIFNDRCTASCYTKEDFDNKGIPTKEINVYYIPKQSVEYIETKITILPTGSGFQQKN